jgi:3-phosphoglycerate kinase
VILERTTLAMSDREKRLFGAFDTLSPGQFRKLKRLGQFHTATERMEILKEGGSVILMSHLGRPLEKLNADGSINKEKLSAKLSRRLQTAGIQLDYDSDSESMEL